MKKIFLLLLSIILSPELQSQQIEVYQILDNSYAFRANVNYEYNGWLPSDSYNLDYQTEGFKTLKVNLNLNHSLVYLPDLAFRWETNLNEANDQELLQAHKDESSMEEAYNKIMFVAGFGKNYLGQQYLDFRNPNNFLQLSYIKDTYYLLATPTSPNLVFKSYDGKISQFTENDELEQFVKFEEYRATFASDYAWIPYILKLLFTAGSDDQPVEIDGRFGFYYNEFNKPYSVSQSSSFGTNNGDKNTIYDALFQSVGIFEKYYNGNDSFYSDISLNLGYAWLNLSEEEIFEDSDSPAFLYTAMDMEVGCNIPLSENLFLNLSASANYGFMYGIDSTNSTNTKDSKNSSKTEDQPLFEINSFINDDLRYKFNVGLTLQL